jgi:NADPH2:quinone reductase
LFDFVRDPAELRRGTEDLFGLIRTGAVSINVQQRFQLADVAAAHAALEGRRTTGSTILLP